MKATKMLLIAAALFQISEMGAKAQDNWVIQPTQIRTKWASEVSPIKPLNDYPRPQLERKNWQNLNGLWEYAITGGKSGQPSKYDGKILVPYPIESALSGVKRSLQPDELLWYKTDLKKTTTKKGERILVHFGAVDFQATVFVNGKEAGVHTGGYTSFTIDLTDQLKVGSNELVVKVWDPTDQGIGPHGKQVLNPSSIYYTPSSGIWQTVWMETVPPDYISGLTITPDIDKSLVNVTVQSETSSAVQITVDGKTVNGMSNILIAVPIHNPKLWSPDIPNLYDLKVKLGKDEVKSYFGMRKISVMKDGKGVDRIALNNKPYYNLGVLDQGFWPDGLYTAPTDEALAFDIKASKVMGFNTIRKHIKVEPARWYYHADKLGMLVWQDMVNPNQSLPEGSKAEFENESKEIMTQLHNYPSITTWVLFNEKWGQYDQERLTKWMKETDPSRIVNGHSGEYLYVNKELRNPSPNAYINADMTDVHSYPDPMMPEKQSGKAQVLGEFGGIGVSIEGHLWDDTKAGWGYDGTVSPQILKKQYTAMVDSLVKLRNKGLSGSIYTQPFDVETEQNGLMTYDREIIKLPVETFRDINKRLYPATKNLIAMTKGFSAKVADTIIRSYNDRWAEYENGKRDSAFLRAFALMSATEHPDISKKVANDFIRALKNPFSDDNLGFLIKFTNTENDPGYALVKNNLKNIVASAERGSIPGTMWDLIYKTRFKTLMTSNPDWVQIERSLDSFPKSGSKMVFLSILNEYMQAFGQDDKNALNNFYAAAVKFDERYRIEGEMLNQIAWFLFEKSKDQNMLIKALEWSKRSIEEKPEESSQMDTYANLLHKLGRTKEAIAWEEKALKYLPGDPTFSDTLEKFKNNVKTWKD